MHIKYVSQTTGLSGDTIRYYEKMGLIKPARTAGNYRQFNEKEIKRLILIKNFKTLGFTIVEMVTVFNLMDQKISSSCNLSSVTLLEDKINKMEQEIKWKQQVLGILKDLHQLVHHDQFEENEHEVHKRLLSLQVELGK